MASGRVETIEMMDIVPSDYDLSCVQQEDRAVALQIIRAVVTLERQMPKVKLAAFFRYPLYSFAFSGLNKHLKTTVVYGTFHSDDRQMEFDSIVETYMNPVTGTFTVRWRSSLAAPPATYNNDDEALLESGRPSSSRRRRKRRRRRD